MSQDVNWPDEIARFLASSRFAVVGASTDRAKYGNKVLRAYLQNGYDAHPVNPRGGIIEGREAYPDLASIPGGARAISIITPPPVTERVIDEAIGMGVGHAWMQPGAESERAIAAGEAAGMNVISAACVLVVLGFREDDAS